MYTAMQIAQYIIEKCTKDDFPISNLQLQKILYYVQKAALQSSDRCPLLDDDFVAWQFGPVVEDVYYNYCGFGAMLIKRIYDTCIDAKTRMLIDPIIEEKRQLNPWDMVQETHKKDGAWDYTFKNLGNGAIIDKNLILQRG